jgi:hypothetical protein
LPKAIQKKAQGLMGAGTMLILLAIFLVPQLNDRIVFGGRALAAWFGVPATLVVRGYRDFAFWL